MFVHACDAGTEEEWRSFIATHGFGELIAGGRNRDLPVVVPTQFVLAGDEILVHFVRRNPVWTAIEENSNVILAVSGDWAFIPSSWKAIADEDPERGIPTTYYASVQLAGRGRVVDDREGIAEVLRAQLSELQPAIGIVDPSAHGRQLDTIRGLRVEITDVRSKFKYGGNVDVAHRMEVAERLGQRDGPGDRAALRHLLRRMGTDPS